jgi:hypothetical protein
MANDATYPLGGTGIYLKQGSTEMVVGSASVQNVYGTVNIQPGATLAVGSSAVITETVTTGTSGITLPNNGHAKLTGGTTATGAKTYPLAAPVAGCRFSAHVTVANVSDCAIVDLNGATLNGLGTQDLIKLTTSADSFMIVGLSTAEWAFTARTPTTVTTTS